MEQNSWQIISKKELWENSLQICVKANFLQSFSFGDFQEKLGNPVWRFGKIENSIVTGFAQVIRLETKFSRFFYIPGGPIVNQPGDLVVLIEEIKKIALREKVNFVRFDPRVLTNEETKILVDSGLRQTSQFTQPEATFILDLSKGLEGLRSNLSESTRYNINAVDKKGVRVEISQDPNDIEIFLGLLEQTATRQKFQLYKARSYYKEQFLSFYKEGFAKLFLAREPENLGNDVLAAAVVIYYADTVTYLHAASSSKNPKLRAPYLMQWRIIEDGQKKGFRNYDFWGASKNDDPKDPWAGVTSFKKGFGGERVFYQPPYDLILKKGYYLDLIVEKIRRPLKKVFR